MKTAYRVIVLHRDVAFLNVTIRCETLDDLAQCLRIIAKHFTPDDGFQIVCQDDGSVNVQN